jgi:hypothetical protein
MILRNVRNAAHVDKINAPIGAQHQYIISLYVNTSKENVQIFKETGGKTPRFLNSSSRGDKDSAQYSYCEGEPWQTILVLTR